jgi:hypothetical protein
VNYLSISEGRHLLTPYRSAVAQAADFVIEPRPITLGSVSATRDGPRCGCQVPGLPVLTPVSTRICNSHCRRYGGEQRDNLPDPQLPPWAKLFRPRCGLTQASAIPTIPQGTFGTIQSRLRGPAFRLRHERSSPLVTTASRLPRRGLAPVA